MCTYSIVKPVSALRCSGRADLSVDIKTALCHRFASPSVVPSTHLAPDMSQTITEQVQVGKHLLQHFTVSLLLQGHCLVGRAQK